MSNAYPIDHAQEDIADVCRHYPIDQSNIVLARFSMGGYGVYRTHIAGLSPLREVVRSYSTDVLSAVDEKVDTFSS
jgi:hypothetical protein